MLKSSKIKRFHWLFALSLSVMLFIVALPVLASSKPQQDMTRLDSYIQESLNKAKDKDWQGVTFSYKEFQKNWFEVEDGVKAVSRPAYREIENSMGDVKFALSTQPPDSAQVVNALQKLHTINQKFITGEFNSSKIATPSQLNQKVTVGSLIERLNRAETALNNQNIDTATQEIKTFQTEWLEVEGVVATKSKQAYVTIENLMATASGMLRLTPPNLGEAKTAIAQLKQNLQPFSDNLRYNFVDAALILLREGVEALLVLVALLAFLTKSGNGEKSRWLWIGSGLGILASIVTALIINLVFSNISTGANRELLEGITGLVAATMLFYVSYWLHSKSALGAWQGYIKEQMTAALATNSIFSLSLLAFLAVFREGAETVLFYIGIAPSISSTDLLLGLGLGTLILIALATLMLGVGLRIPLKPFFLVTSILIYYLGFKFVGSGIHALQVAGILPASPATFLPAYDGLGLYPTWETTLVQLGLIAIAIFVVIISRGQNSQNDRIHNS